MDQLILVTWKSALVFLSLVGLARVIGRKLLAQMSYFDFTIAIMLGTIAGSYVVQMVEGMWVLISPFLIALFAIVFDRLQLKFLKLRKITEGEPVVVMQNGIILNQNMKRLRYHLDNLEAQLRNMGIFDFNEVEFAILEPHGQLSVLKKAPHLPLTPKDMNLQAAYRGMSTELVKDGQLLEQNLHQRGLTRQWLTNELKSRGIASVSDIFYAAVNTDNILYVSLKDASPKHPQKVED
ncbi:hypothetical protein SDC9_108554 [bioreactor metagenome]|uniref:YetF C-terminal domain-containing protein n=1 Tax=bioreactor metagenome TaxID=1076179 RepID=A0A645BIY3_9ZZZZ